MLQATLGSLWKDSQKSRDCFGILFIWTLSHGLFEWMPAPTSPGRMALVLLFRMFFDPFVVLLVAERLLQIRVTTEGKTGWNPVFRATSRLYIRSFVIIICVFALTIVLYKTVGLDAAIADKTLAGRLKTVSLGLPFSILKILWLSALVGRGRGLIKSVGRGVGLLFRSRLVLVAVAVWALALWAEALYSPAELQMRSLSLATGWLVAGSVIVAVALRFVYTVTVHEYGAVFGLKSGDFAASPEAGLQTAGPVPAPSVSLWWVFFSFVPVLSLAAFFKGRAAARRLEWRSIRAVLAYSFGLFFTLVHLLVLVGANLPRATEPATNYAFLSEADRSLEQEVNLLAAGDFQQASDRLTKPKAEAPNESWTRLTALAITQRELTRPEEALASLEKASTLNPDRSEFHYLYGRLLLDQGQRSHASEHLVQARKLGLKEELTAPLLNLARINYQPTRWVLIAWSIIILVLLFAVHEFAHAYSAYKLGDDTAAEQGRLTLNPIAHLDIFGSVILPGILLWRGSDLVFGWAKPVPVNPEKFSNPRHDHMLVSFAGPAANLIIAMAGALLLLLILVDVRLLSPAARSLDLADPTAGVSLVGSGVPGWIMPVIAFLKQLTITSLILACFNLIPMPPLDGSWILSGIAPERFRAKVEAIRPYGFVIFLLLVWTPAFDFLLAIPVGLMWAGGAACFGLMGFN